MVVRHDDAKGSAAAAATTAAATTTAAAAAAAAGSVDFKEASLLHNAVLSLSKRPVHNQPHMRSRKTTSCPYTTTHSRGISSK